MIQQRLQRLRRELPEQVDAALIISDVNRRYYTGMASSAGTLLAMRDQAELVIDFRYIEKAKAVAQGCTVTLQQREIFKQMRAIVEKHGVKTIAVETQHMTVSEFEGWKKALPGVTFLSGKLLDDIILSHRSVKTAEELVTMRQAQAITDRSFTELLNFIRAGRTEREVASELEYIMRKFGGDGLAFDTIAVSGKNSSMPHGVPTEKPIEPGDFLTLDFGALKDGYCSDMTRTVAVGHVSDEQKKVYDAVLKAQNKAFEVIKAGASCKMIDHTARSFIEDAGYKGCFGHALGHSLGLEIHEEPRFSPMTETFAAAGNVLSVEPGIYLEGKFGVRIEDVVVVTEVGFENLTHSPKQLIIL
ncbi:M24 family metallopeptidase [Oscillospiraceae bacterium LTW-04]|nr:Xaa-Pro peptidase family protein [Oscillospiraceae bacterium MB24-C1]